MTFHSTDDCYNTDPAIMNAIRIIAARDNVSCDDIWSDPTQEQRVEIQAYIWDCHKSYVDDATTDRLCWGDESIPVQVEVEAVHLE